jgi:cytosine/creatinine deaminase
MPHDLVIRRAQLRDRAGLVDLAIDSGRFTLIAEGIDSPGREEIDAAGRLVTEPFVDTHFHIDKSFYGETRGRYTYPLRELESSADDFAGELRSGMVEYEQFHENVVPIEETWAFKRAYTVQDVAERVSRALRLALQHGTLALRMFADVDSHAGLTALRGVLRAKERFSDVMDLQVCAFPQEGLTTNPRTHELLAEAVHEGADVIGGLPWVEWDEAAAQEHIDFCFDLAMKHDLDLHFLCDDTDNPNARTLERVAIKALRTNYLGRVASAHNGALRHYPDVHAAKVIELVRQARMSITANAHVNALGTYTRVPELLRAGVNVCVGQDDLDNFYYPLGRADLLDAVHYTVHLARLATPRGFEVAYDIATHNGAKALRLTDYGIAEGNTANVQLYAAHNLHGVLQMNAERSYVVSRGSVVVETKRESTWRWQG